MYDFIIIGGGWYGSMIAQSLPGKVALIEKEKDLMTKASLNNQARIHNGYHYPRHYLTAWSSFYNYTRFCNEFNEAINDSYTMLYPITKTSKTSAKDFYKLYKNIGTPIKKANSKYNKIFNMDLIDSIFEVQEAAYNANKLKDILYKRLKNVKKIFNEEVKKVSQNKVHLKNSTFSTKHIIVCAYASTNNLLKNSNLPELPIKLELTLMPIVELPKKYQNIGITIMDGNFFAVFPYPIYPNTHSIHHVEHTPLCSPYSKFYKEVCKYIPAYEKIKHIKNIYELKVKLLQNEMDDGRPILYKKDYGFKNLDIIVGAKIDNIYDLLDRMKSSNNLNIT